jgi:hypothetical protein
VPRDMLGRGIVLGLALAGILVVGLPSAPPPGAGLTPNPPASAASAPAGAPTIVTGQRAFDSTQLHSPTADTGQSRVWFHDGAWWAVMTDRATTSLGIQRLEADHRTWTDTGTIVDDRIEAHVDVFADGDELLVASAGTLPGSAHDARFSRFTYVAAQQRYVRAPDFPVALTSGGVDAIQVARDTSGVIWIAYLSGGKAVVRNDRGTGVAWSDPIVIPTLPATDVERLALVAGAGRVLVVAVPADGSSVQVASRVDGDPADRWTTAQTTIDSAAMTVSTLSASISGSGHGVFIVVGMTPLSEVAAAAASASPPSATAGGPASPPAAKALPSSEGVAPPTTSPATPVPPPANPLAPRVELLALDADGRWRTSVVAIIADLQTRPVVVVDDEHARVWVISTAPGTTGALYAKSAPFEHLAFPSGRGTLLADGPGGKESLRFATSTKQPVGSATGLLVLASDDTAGLYVHAWVDLSASGDGGAQPSLPPASAAPRGPTNRGDTGPTILVDDRFDVYAPGVTPSGNWEVKAAAGTPSNAPLPRTARRSDGPGNALLVPAATGAITVCRAFDPVSSGILTVDVDVRIDAVPTSDVTITSVRAGSIETASVRFDWKSVFAYYRGGTKVRTTVLFRPGTWYRSVVRVDLAAKTYDWTVTPLGAAAPVIRLTAIPWRTPGAPGGVAPSELCVRGAVAPSAAGLLIDSILVEQPSAAP